MDNPLGTSLDARATQVTYAKPTRVKNKSAAAVQARVLRELCPRIGALETALWACLCRVDAFVGLDTAF